MLPNHVVLSDDRNILGLIHLCIWVVAALSQGPDDGASLTITDHRKVHWCALSMNRFPSGEMNVSSVAGVQPKIQKNQTQTMLTVPCVTVSPDGLV